MDLERIIAKIEEKYKHESGLGEFVIDNEVCVFEMVKGEVVKVSFVDEELYKGEKWDFKYIAKLPDIAFAIIAPGGVKKDGITRPLSKRHLPHHNKSVKSATSNGPDLDIPHLRNALARIDQVKGITEDLRAKGRRHLEAHAKAVLPTYKKKRK